MSIKGFVRYLQFTSAETWHFHRLLKVLDGPPWLQERMHEIMETKRFRVDSNEQVSKVINMLQLHKNCPFCDVMLSKTLHKLSDNPIGVKSYHKAEVVQGASVSLDLKSFPIKQRMNMGGV